MAYGSDIAGGENKWKYFYNRYTSLIFELSAYINLTGLNYDIKH